jgi:ABC-2 type transport system ATP-binding protein
MVHNPQVLVLDEPTAGVDIELRQQLWAYVKKLNTEGTTVILTTHYLEEAQELCDTIAIINHGEVVACEPTESLLGKLDMKNVRLVLGQDINEVPKSLRKFNATLSHGRRLSITFRPSETEMAKILEAVTEDGLDIVDLTTEEPDLEDAFLQMTSKR